MNPTPETPENPLKRVRNAIGGRFRRRFQSAALGGLCVNIEIRDVRSYERCFFGRGILN